MTGVRTIRSQLLVAINVAMAVLSCVFLIVDYHREISQRVEEKHVALEEEARTLAAAVSRIRPQGIEATKEYINDVCGQMQEATSPGHHIAVRLDQTVLQAVAHRRASPEIFQAMERAAESPAHRAVFGEEELVVGTARRGDLTVYISEYLSNIRRAAHEQIVRRLPRILLLVAVLAVVVNVVFLRVVARPLGKLVETVEQIAQGRLGVQTGPLGSKEFTYLAGAVNSMSRSLAATDQHRRREMARARRIQEQLMPHEVHIPGLTVVELYQPAEEVAGDYYDVLPLAGGSWLLCISDVAGHGVPAAMSAMMLKAFLLHATEHHTTLVQILQFVNGRLCALWGTENLASMFLARYEPEAMVLEYASAGHETGLLLTATGSLRELRSTGLMLSVLEDASWTSESLTVNAGDRLLLVTDGVTEAFNPQEELFGRQALADVFIDSRGVPLADMVRRLDQALTAHRTGREPTDDATVLAVEFGTGRESRPHVTERVELAGGSDGPPDRRHASVEPRERS
jgi:sigma-B regulation protein RsbU (phosphoserine phosphatase)